MKVLPKFVQGFLVRHGYANSVKLLIIGENYPASNYAKSYFYRSILNNGVVKQGTFFKYLCDGLGVPKLDKSGSPLIEAERLDAFLKAGYVVIDAQTDGVAPLRPAVLSSARVSDLIMSIKQLNPERIMFITENNRHVLSALKKDRRFAPYQNRVVQNSLKSREWFCFPAPPANPNLFKSEVDDARSQGHL